jgi:hypothetical protein
LFICDALEFELEFDCATAMLVTKNKTVIANAILFILCPPQTAFTRMQLVRWHREKTGYCAPELAWIGTSPGAKPPQGARRFLRMSAAGPIQGLGMIGENA